MIWDRFFRKAENILKDGEKHYWLNKKGINDCEATRCTNCGIYGLVEEGCYGQHRIIKKTTGLMRRQLANLKGLKKLKQRRF